MLLYSTLLWESYISVRNLAKCLTVASSIKTLICSKVYLSVLLKSNCDLAVCFNLVSFNDSQEKIKWISSSTSPLLHILQILFSLGTFCQRPTSTSIGRHPALSKVIKERDFLLLT